MLSKCIDVLVAITIVVICYFLIVWVLQLLQVSVPEKLLTAIMVLIALVAVGGAATGRYTFSSWWTPKP